jgi:hypothetical protein
LENVKERDHLGDIGIDEKVNTKIDLKEVGYEDS